MSANLPSTEHELYLALTEVGFPLPDEIVHIRIEGPSDGVIQLHVVCNLTGPMMHKLGQAFQLMAVKQRLT